ncbi:MAG: SEC-C metal-binding domain-containing protein [Gemmataceae bacterium]
MPLNPYDTCPCGSGKKFKFCCTPYYGMVEQALNQQQSGQHEMCLKTVEEMTSKHKDYPPVWGYAAQVLYNEGKAAEAEAALEKGFALQPNFPMGLFLRGLFRQNEGELIGALLLYRKAADAYDPAAHDQLAYVYEVIARNELMLNRPVACHAALERACHFQPNDQELRNQYQAMFGPNSRMPNCAKKKYAFRKTMRPIPAGADTGRLSDAKAAFEKLTVDAPNDPAVWFNLGLVRAWLGEQPTAVEALNHSVELEMDDARAEEAAALAEVLKSGAGMENDSDHVEYRFYYPIRDPGAVSQLLQVWAQEGRLFNVQMDEQGTQFSALIIEPLPNLLETGTTLAKVVAHLMISGGVLRLWNSVKETVEKVAVEVKDRLNLAVAELVSGIAPAQLGDATQEAIAYPVRISSQEEAEKKVQDYAEHFFESVWSNRSLKSLGGATPLDAAGSKLMRKRLLGIIRFMDDCLRSTAPGRRVGDKVEMMTVYDFDRLRHKLGAEVLATAAPTGEVRDFAAMSAADLAAVPLAGLSVSELADGMRAAMKLDARELAVNYAKAAVSRPADPAYPDRFPFYFALANGLVAGGDVPGAVALLTEGAAHDSTHNESKRGADFGRQKGKVLARSGDAAGAAAAFDAVLEAHPDDPRNYIEAAETMLRIKEKSLAARFAEAGLAKAKSLGNRDLEGACQELAAAAKK